MEINFSTWTPRCSSLGYIMGESKEKSYFDQYNETLNKWKVKNDELGKCTEKQIKTSEKLFDECEKLMAKLEILKPLRFIDRLSDGAKTHLCDVYTAVKYGRRENFESKYTEKGLLLEEDAITLWSEVTGKFHKKNKVRENNGWIEGECDIDGDEVIDTKVNWSIFQFNRVMAKPINQLYYWQLKGYMWLFNKDSAKLVYALLDTPEHLIIAEEKKLLYRFVGAESDYREASAELRRNLTYPDIPKEERVRVFDVTRNSEDEEKIKNRVNTARKFLIDLQNKNYEITREYSED